jgi:hypothetical protein
MTSATDRVPCSDQSLARDDQMYGTASAGAKWLMLELAGPWGNSAFLQSPTVIDPQLGRAIARRAEAAGLRIAAIRRPGRRSPEPRWRWFVAHSQVSEETLLHGEVGDPREYLDVSLDGSDGEVASLPLVAVCAHGKHDQCCAVRGRGAVAAIAAHYPELTWECSHLGGDRFAATMLILPEGLCYGRVDAADPPDLVRLYLDRRLDNAFLRGRTSLPHVAQAAQYFAREVFRGRPHRSSVRVAGAPDLRRQDHPRRTSGRIGSHRRSAQGADVRNLCCPNAARRFPVEYVYSRWCRSRRSECRASCPRRE